MGEKKKQRDWYRIAVIALAVLAGMIYMLFFKKYQEATRLTRSVEG